MLKNGNFQAKGNQKSNGRINGKNQSSKRGEAMRKFINQEDYIECLHNPCYASVCRPDKCEDCSASLHLKNEQGRVELCFTPHEKKLCVVCKEKKKDKKH